MSKINEDEKILDMVVDELLDENTDVKVETTYRADLKDRKDNVYADELTTKPGIPTQFGKDKEPTHPLSRNAERAGSVKIGKISMIKQAGGFKIRMPDGQETTFKSTVDYNRKAYCVWLAALSKYDHNSGEMQYYLRLVGYDKPTTKNTKKHKFDVAKEQMEALGIPQEQQVHLNKMRKGRE